jgi:hypothetical protein
MSDADIAQHIKAKGLRADFDANGLVISSPWLPFHVGVDRPLSLAVVDPAIEAMQGLAAL